MKWLTLIYNSRNLIWSYTHLLAKVLILIDLAK